MKGERQANIELLRILAMFMILVIHANMISLPRPTHLDSITSPSPVITRYFIESLGIVGVNVFVMISGWFLIHTRAKSFLSFLFQVMVFWGGIFLIMLILHKTSLSFHSISEAFFFTKWDWFIKAYIVLMILAPVLNTFIENSTEKQQRYVLLGFFLFSSTYGWLGGGRRFFVNGYGPLLLIGLYLLAHYIRKAPSNADTPKFIKRMTTFDKRIDLLIYILCAVINTVMGIATLYYHKFSYGQVYAYVNPFTIIGATYLLLFFSKLHIKFSKIIKFLATGSFAVYLFHSQVDIRPFFTDGNLYLFNHFSGIVCIGIIFIYLIIWYLISVIIDLPRLWLWKKISKAYNIE